MVIFRPARALLGKRHSAHLSRYMSLVSAATAIKVFLKKLEVAQDMATAGAVGSVLYSVLCDADKLLNLVDEELADVDRERHASLFATTPMLRRKMDRLRAGLRSRNQLGYDSADSRWQEMPKSTSAVLARKMYEEHCAACAAASISAPTVEGWVDLIEDMLRS